MQAGRLDRRIRLERAIRGPRSASGQPTKSWTLQAEVWAELVENRGQEGFASNAVAATAELRFRIRYPATLSPLPGPDEDFRVVYGGVAYDVVQAPEIGRREGMFLYAKGRAEVAA